MSCDVKLDAVLLHVLRQVLNFLKENLRLQFAFPNSAQWLLHERFESGTDSPLPVPEKGEAVLADL